MIESLVQYAGFFVPVRLGTCETSTSPDMDRNIRSKRSSFWMEHGSRMMHENVTQIAPKSPTENSCEVC